MIGPAEPRALGVNRLMLVAVPATASLIVKLSGLSLLLFSALAMADFKVFETTRAPLQRHHCEHRLRLQRGEPLDLPHHLAHFLRGHRTTFW